MSVGKRITGRLDALGMSQAELARRVNLAQPTINNLIHRAKVGSSHLHKIARALETTPEYLAGETENASAGFVPAPTNQAVAADMGMVPVREFDLAIGLGSAYLDDDGAAIVHYFPREWLDLYSRAPSDKLMITRGSGDSMIPTLLDNDLILIDTTQTNPRLTDQVWAVSYCGLGSVKRLRPMPDGGWLLLADNTAIPPITAYDGEMHVLGRVCGYFRKM